MHHTVYIAQITVSQNLGHLLGCDWLVEYSYSFKILLHWRITLLYKKHKLAMNYCVRFLCLMT